MGRVTVEALIENLEDLFEVRVGRITDQQVRRVTVTNALIDTGCTGLLLPSQLIQQLGLTQASVQNAKTVAGPTKITIYRAVKLTVQGRECISDVGEISNDHAVIIGQIPLELMDWLVDPRGQKLMGNPEHGGQHMIEI